MRATARLRKGRAHDVTWTGEAGISAPNPLRVSRHVLDLRQHPRPDRPHRHHHRRQHGARLRDGPHARAARRSCGPRLPQSGQGFGGASPHPRAPALRLRHARVARPLRPGLHRLLRPEDAGDAAPHRPAHQQRRRHGPAPRQNGAGLRTPVWNQPPGPLRAHRAAAAPARQAARCPRGRGGQHGAALREHFDRRPQLGAPSLQRLAGLRAEQAGQHDVCARAAAPAGCCGLRAHRHGGASRLDGDRPAALRPDVEPVQPASCDAGCQGGPDHAARGDGSGREGWQLLGADRVGGDVGRARRGLHPGQGDRC